MYFLQQPATCTKCGHTRPSNGSDDDRAMRLDGFVVCPVCFEAMLRQFCGRMKPDVTFASPSPHHHDKKPNDSDQAEDA